MLPTPPPFLFVVNMDGIVPLDEVHALLSTWASFPEDEDQPPGLVPEEEDEVLHATMARTVRTRPKDTGAGKCRVSGVPDPSKSGVGKRLGKTKSEQSSSQRSNTY